MKALTVGASVVVQNDESTIIQSLSSYYNAVQHIVVSTDPKRGWSGAPIIPDGTLDRIRALDRESKIDIVQGSFCNAHEAIQNDTAQRNATEALLIARCPRMDWILTPDADEVFLDLPQFIDRLGRLPIHIRVVSWDFIVLFKQIGSQQFLVVTDEAGRPHMDRLPLAHRPGEILVACRHIKPPVRRLYARNHEYLATVSDVPLLHFSWAKPQGRIREKLQTWGHARAFETDRFFNLWLEADEKWQSIHNFHPLSPDAWPSLRPFHLTELQRWAHSRPNNEI